MVQPFSSPDISISPLISLPSVTNISPTVRERTIELHEHEFRVTQQELTIQHTQYQLELHQQAIHALNNIPQQKFDL